MRSPLRAHLLTPKAKGESEALRYIRRNSPRLGSREPVAQWSEYKDIHYPRQELQGTRVPRRIVQHRQARESGAADDSKETVSKTHFFSTCWCLTCHTAPDFHCRVGRCSRKREMSGRRGRRPGNCTRSLTPQPRSLHRRDPQTQATSLASRA